LRLTAEELWLLVLISFIGFYEISTKPPLRRALFFRWMERQKSAAAHLRVRHAAPL
jgi:hypothetical protein